MTVYLPNLYFDFKIPYQHAVGHSTVHVHDVVTDWSYALAEFLVSSLFRAFLFLEILATFTLQMFFSFDSLSFFLQ